MSSKPMENAALVHNEEMEGHQAQYNLNPPGYSGQQNRTYSGQPAAGYYTPPVGVELQSTNNSNQMNAGPQQPIVVVDTGVEPQTTPSLVVSTLNTIFCWAWPLGLMAIALSWQARLRVLDRKYAHARHTLTISWIINGMGFVFGLVIWGLLIWLIARVTSYNRYRYGY